MTKLSDAVEKITRSVPEGTSEADINFIVDEVLKLREVEEILGMSDADLRATVSTFTEEGLAADQPSVVQPQIDAELAAQPRDIEELQQILATNPTALSEEELAQLEQHAADNPEETGLASLLTSLFQAQAPSWLSQVIQGPVTGDDLQEIMNIAISLDPSLESVLSAGGLEFESPDQTMTRNFNALLSSQNDFVAEVVDVWGDYRQRRIQDVMIGGVKFYEAKSFADALGVTIGRASIALRHANEAGVSPELFAIAWQANRDIEKEKELFSPKEFDPKTGPGASGGLGSAAGAAAGEAVIAEQERYRFDGDIANKIAEGIDIYGEGLAAIVHVGDANLASRLFSDPWSLSAEELARVQELTGDGQYQLAGAGGLQQGWVEERLAGGFGGPTINVDSASAVEAARNLAAGWNMPGLPGSVLNGIVGGWIGSIADGVRSSLPNPFNPQLANPGSTIQDLPDANTYIEQSLRMLPQYQEFFANKDPGETEEQYASRFVNQSNRLTGENNLTASRAGMRAGSRNTVGQNLLATQEGFESSTFQQRLAQMAQAFRQAT